MMLGVLIFLAVVIGLLLFVWALAMMPRNRKAAAVASALFFGLGFYNPNAEKIVETREDAERGKSQKSGDPPEP